MVVVVIVVVVVVMVVVVVVVDGYGDPLGQRWHRLVHFIVDVDRDPTKGGACKWVHT